MKNIIKKDSLDKSFELKTMEDCFNLVNVLNYKDDDDIGSIKDSVIDIYKRLNEQIPKFYSKSGMFDKKVDTTISFYEVLIHNCERILKNSGDLQENDNYCYVEIIDAIKKIALYEKCFFSEITNLNYPLNTNLKWLDLINLDVKKKKNKPTKIILNEKIEEQKKDEILVELKSDEKGLSQREIVIEEGKCWYCRKEIREPNRKTALYCSLTCKEKGNEFIKNNPDIVWKRKCQNCGKEFYTTPENSFCSKSCSKIYSELHKESQDTEIAKCKKCGGNFIPNNEGEEFCSIECKELSSFHNILIERRNCEQCGKEFKWSSRNPKQKYCSFECRKLAKVQNSNNRNKKKIKKDLEPLYNEIHLRVSEIISKMYETGNSFNGKYIDYWNVGNISEKTRMEVLERDDHRCQVCDKDSNLHLHHLIKRRNGGDHSAENLITLCASCHRHIETRDVEHATKKCFENAKIYYNYSSKEEREISIGYVRSLMNKLYNIFSDSVDPDPEIMIQLDEIIDVLEDM